MTRRRWIPAVALILAAYGAAYLLHPRGEDLGAKAASALKGGPSPARGAAPPSMIPGSLEEVQGGLGAPERLEDPMAAARRMLAGSDAGAAGILKAFQEAGREKDLLDALAAALEGGGQAALEDWIRGIHWIEGAQDPTTAAGILGRLLGPGHDAFVKGLALSALGNLGEAAPVALMIPVLGDPEEGLRSEAAEALKRLKRAGLAAPLLAFLRSPVSPEAMDMADDVLGSLRDPKAGAVMLSALSEGGLRSRSRIAIIRALGEMAFKEAEPVLRSLIHTTQDPYERMAAFEALGRLRTPQATQAVAGYPIQQETSPAVVKAWADAVGDSAPPDAVSLLSEAFSRSRDPEVRNGIVETVGELADPGNGGSAAVRAEAKQQLVAWGQQSQDPAVAGAAGTALAKVITDQDLVIVQPMLSNGDPSVQARGLNLAGKTQSPEAIPMITPFLGNEDYRLRTMAVMALSWIPDPSVGGYLETAQQDQHPFVQRFAAMAFRNHQKQQKP